jgi:fructokinase
MRLGIDLGGTKIEVIVIGDDGATLVRQRRPTPRGDYAATLDCIAALVAEAESSAGRTRSVGVATPGAISATTGLLKNSNSTVLNGKRLDHDLAARLGREVRLENDANCLALSEAVDGAAPWAEVVFGVILGTGVGGGVVVNKRLLHGRNLIGGEWGHNCLPWMHSEELAGAISCYCGQVGCIETFLCGAGMTRDFERRTGNSWSAEAIVSRARANDSDACASLESYLDRLARSLGSVINILDPDAIVLGGGLSNIDELYRSVPPRLSRYTFSDGVDTPILRAVHGDSSGVRGAAWLWP